MAAAPGQVTHRKRSALIVDDSKLACAVLSRLLEQEGYDIDLADSGHEALQRVRDAGAAAITVRRGDRVRAGETVIARLAAPHA